MDVEKYHNIEEFLNRLSLFNNQWYENGDRQCHWIFRGQKDSTAPLQPAITRNNRYNEIFDFIQEKLLPKNVPDLKAAIINTVQSSIGNSDNIYKERLSEIIKKAFIEIDLIENFVIQANELGFYVPTLKLFHEQYSEISSVEFFYNNVIKFINKFAWLDGRRNVLYESMTPSLYNQIPYKKFIEFDYPEANALAQHHGIPTRFLDWTKNPLYAVFFANEESVKNDTICVWALNTRYISSCLSMGQIKLHKKLPHKGLEFLHYQQGLFTEMIGSEGYYYHHGDWPSLDKYINASDKSENFLKKFELIIHDPDEILSKLNNMNISKIHLMPTYDNIAIEVIRKSNMVANEDSKKKGNFLKRIFNKLT